MASQAVHGVLATLQATGYPPKELPSQTGLVKPAALESVESEKNKITVSIIVILIGFIRELLDSNVLAYHLFFLVFPAWLERMFVNPH